MQKRRTRHGIHASPYGTQHNGHTYGIRTVQRIQGQDTAYGLHRPYRIHHILEKHTSRTLHVCPIPAYSCRTTCSNGQYCRTVAWVSCVCMCCMCCTCTCISVHLRATIRIPCFLATLHPPPLLHSLRLTDGYEIVDCGLSFLRSSVLEIPPIRLLCFPFHVVTD